MTSGAIVVLLFAGVIGLAVLILWLRDRHRDRIGMPQETRKEAEKKLSRGVQAIYLIGEAAAAFGAIASTYRKGAYAQDFASVAFLAFFLWLEWKRWTKRARSKTKRRAPEDFATSASKENWRPPGMPPPIG